MGAEVGKGVSDATAAAGGSTLTRLQYARILLAVGLGIILEWYDFVVYAQLSATLTYNFFPSGKPATEALAFWGVFAVGFVSRPLGSIIFGHIGDVYGRKPCLMLTVSIMGVATTLIGCLPTFQMVGLAAPMLLAVLRLIQGLAMGGEFGCSLVYLHEVAPPKRKGLSGAVGFACAMGGIAIGVGLVMIVIGACNTAQLTLWGWRLPFLLAITTATAALLLRMHMEEPPEFQEAKLQHQRDLQAAADAAAVSSAENGAAAASTQQQQQRAPLSVRILSQPFVALLRTHWKELGLQFGFEAAVSVSFWLCTSYLPGYFQSKVGMPAELSLGMLLFNLFAMAPVILLSGWLCDDARVPRVGVAVGVYVVLAGVSVPMFLAFGTKSWAACWLLQLVFMCLLGWVLGMLPNTMSMLYPPMQRTSGFNFAHNCAMSLMGGLAPTVVTAITITTGKSATAAGWYILAVTLFSIVAGVIIMFLFPEVNRPQRKQPEPQSKQPEPDMVAQL